MQKKSHKRKFQVGQMVKVLGSIDFDFNSSPFQQELYAESSKPGKIQEYCPNNGPYLQNYMVNGWWFKAIELEAIQEESQEEFFEEKETDGPIAKVLLKVLELIPEDADNPEYTSQYTCDIIDDVTSGFNAQVLDFLDTFGFESYVNGFHKFSEFEEGFHRQSARFNWILFALMQAREQGV